MHARSWVVVAAAGLLSCSSSGGGGDPSPDARAAVSDAAAVVEADARTADPAADAGAAVIDAAAVSVVDAAAEADAGGVTGPGVTAQIEPGGGMVKLEGTAWVTFPAGAFSAKHAVRLEKTSDPLTAEAFEGSTAIFRPSSRLGYEIRINTGASPPAQDVAASLQVPAELAVPSGSDVEAFVQVWEENELDIYDHFELMDATYDAGTKVLTVALPPWAFTPFRRTDTTFEAIVTIAPTPGSSRSPGKAPRRPGLASDKKILFPLKDIYVTDFFGFRGVHPVTGLPKPHEGIDLRAGGNVLMSCNGGAQQGEGVPIFAVGDGTVARTTLCKTAYGPTPGCTLNVAAQTCNCAAPLPAHWCPGDQCFGCRKSFGNWLVLDLGGPAVTYAHLQNYDVEVGDKVLAGQEIGVTDNTGASTGPHLHFELAPGGAAGKKKVDPYEYFEDRPLLWHLAATVVVDFQSQISNAHSTLKLAATIDFLAKSDGTMGMVLTPAGNPVGTFTVESYTGGFDTCTYVFAGPKAYPIKMNDGNSVPAEGETLGGAELFRAGKSGYKVDLAFTTDERPKYQEVCANSSQQSALLLSGTPWAAEPMEAYLDPLDTVTQGSRTVDSSIKGFATQTTTFKWTLTKKY